MTGALFAGAALVGGTDSGVAGGARSGSWCLPLSKMASENAYDFSLYELDGKGDGIFTLSELLGRPVWLNFFASWCAPCNAEAADIVRIAGKYGDALCVVGVDVKEQPEQARGFRELHKIPYRIILDETGSVSKALGFNALPTHVFLDARGVITCISEGDLTADQMDNEVAVALARAPIPRS